MEDLYQLLGLPKDCTFEEIKHQFRILARIHHPDMGGDVEKFKEIKFAYEVLSDPDRRAEYDRSGQIKQSLDILQEAKMNLSNLFFHILPLFDPNTEDIIDICRNEIKKSMENLKQEKTGSDNYIVRLELVKSKLRKKSNNPEDDNLFKGFLDNALNAKQNETSNFDRRLEISEEMLRILDDYQYGFIELQTIIEGGGERHPHTN